MVQKTADDTVGDEEDDGASVNVEMRTYDVQFEEELDLGECGEGADGSRRRLDFDDETSESDLYHIDEEVIDFPAYGDRDTIEGRRLAGEGEDEGVFPYQ
jgi:hypothetical protein